MIFDETFDRGRDDCGETDSVRFGDLPDDVPVGIAETAHYTHRVPVDVVLHQSPLDEVPEILLHKAADIFTGAVPLKNPRSE